MRINFKGPFTTIDPIVIGFSDPGTYSFDPSDYPDHIFYDVIVIGAGGGNGGGMAGEDPDHAGHMVTAYGGGGGGGGFHRRRGLLELLGGPINVIVGAAGTDGADGDDITPGDDGVNGGPSKFGDFVLATGGKGGSGCDSISADVDRNAHGGQGGVGGTESIDAGGGALGGLTDADPANGTQGQNGKLISHGRFYIASIDEYTMKGLVGQGGGGGPGGAYYAFGGSFLYQGSLALKGGKGSFNSDGDVFDPGSKAQEVFPSPDVGVKVKPGLGGGARVTPLNNTNAVYGRGRTNGAVFIRLSLEVDGSLG